MLKCTAIILSRNIAINVNAVADYRAEHHLIALIVKIVSENTFYIWQFLTYFGYF